MVSLAILGFGMVAGAGVGVAAMLFIIGKDGWEKLFAPRPNSVDINWMDTGKQEIRLMMRGVPVFIGLIDTVTMSNYMHTAASVHLELREKEYYDRFRATNLN